jgi:hypothetical protein
MADKPETIAYPLVSIDDAAMAIINMFKNKKDYVGKTIFFAGDKLTTREIVSRFASTHMGLPVKHASLEIEEFVKGFTNAEGLLRRGALPPSSAPSPFSLLPSLFSLFLSLSSPSTHVI